MDGLGLTPAFYPGSHYLFEFPVQGTGTYNITLDAPSGMEGQIAIATNVTTDSTMRAKLVLDNRIIIQHRPVAFALVLLDGQSPVAPFKNFFPPRIR